MGIPPVIIRFAYIYIHVYMMDFPWKTNLQRCVGSPMGSLIRTWLSGQRVAAENGWSDRVPKTMASEKRENDDAPCDKL
jgi:hypothetical protein